MSELSPDNVHLSNMEAKALIHKFLSDVSTSFDDRTNMWYVFSVWNRPAEEWLLDWEGSALLLNAVLTPGDMLQRKENETPGFLYNRLTGGHDLRKSVLRLARELLMQEGVGQYG